MSIHNQPTINIGMIGSVSNGKSSITEKITGIKTQRHSSETKRNITVKLGYANAKIFKCYDCSKPDCFQAKHSSVLEAPCKYCDRDMELVKHVSFVDSPGHNLLMATMLNGTCVMDTTILVESAANNGVCKQSEQHLIATKIANLGTKITCLNKLDLVDQETAKHKLELLKNDIKDTTAENSLIVPTVANHNINIDILCEYICSFEEPSRDLKANPEMIIVRSFNINRQNVPIEKLEGAVVGGTLTTGSITIGQNVMILPGVITKNEQLVRNRGKPVKWKYKPLEGKVQSINSEDVNLEKATPGGLIGVKLDIDPAFSTKDKLIGNVLTAEHKFRVYERLFVELELIEKDFDKNTQVVINSNACNVKCSIVKMKKNRAELELLDRPICTNQNKYITLSRNYRNNITILGRAKILDGIESLV